MDRSSQDGRLGLGSKSEVIYDCLEILLPATLRRIEQPSSRMDASHAILGRDIQWRSSAGSSGGSLKLMTACLVCYASSTISMSLYRILVSFVSACAGKKVRRAWMQSVVVLYFRVGMKATDQEHAAGSKSMNPADYEG